MLFNSFAFLIFLPLFLIGYFATTGRARLLWMMAGSFFFYGWWNWRYLLLMVVVILVNYWGALLIDRSSDPRRRKAWLIAACVFNLGLLGYFKYFDFFIASVQEGLQSLGIHTSDHTLGILLPIGISFYIFHATAYVVDVYRRDFRAEPDPVRVMTFVSFFPQLVAGPIVRGTELLPQLRGDRHPSWAAIQSGLALILVGFFKKVVVADSCSPVVTNIFNNPDLVSSLNLLLGMYLYAIQIYCDFSGYTDIGIGVARLLGIELPQNFNKPYFSSSFSQFWTRWHMTLSRWLRDYLYIPLGGNRGGPLKTYRNLMITMLLGGLWHGANWTFVVWGFLHGMYLILQRLLSAPFAVLTRTLRIPPRLVHLFLVLLVFHLTCFAWIFFRSQTLGDATTFISRLASLNPAEWNPRSVRQIQDVARAVLLGSLLLGVELVTIWYPLEPIFRRNPWMRPVAGAVLIIMCLVLGNFVGQQFIYFQF
ncbi:MAG: MBOAT family protein [Pyrinomonadaceae bacterium]|nr:MBOAT family protein [Phycisphaerales bacterium]